MSQQQPPPLAQYPGYFPAGKGPFWTRLKVGLGAGVLGLLIGAVGSSGGSEAAPPVENPPAAADPVDNGAVVDAAVAKERSAWQAKLATQQTQAKADLQKARQTARAELARVRHEARKAQRVAVREAVAEAKADQPPAVVPLTGNTDTSTDPMFDYCYEANDAGYGNYVSGEDPEYDWYDDADHDGVVCEF
jgi:hypothetical protein